VQLLAREDRQRDEVGEEAEPHDAGDQQQDSSDDGEQSSGRCRVLRPGDGRGVMIEIVEVTLTLSGRELPSAPAQLEGGTPAPVEITISPPGR
jgi:hypothetical protein